MTRAHYLRISNVLPLLDRILEYVIHFITTINAFLQCCVSCYSFSGLPVSSLDFLVSPFHVSHFPPRFLFRSVIFRSAIFSRPWLDPDNHRLMLAYWLTPSVTNGTLIRNRMQGIMLRRSCCTCVYSFISWVAQYGQCNCANVFCQWIKQLMFTSIQEYVFNSYFKQLYIAWQFWFFTSYYEHYNYFVVA